MKKISFNFFYSFKLFISAIAIVFLLQSCCFLEGYDVSKRRCNCKDDNKPGYAVNSNKLVKGDATQAAFRPEMTRNMEPSINNNFITPVIHDAVNLPAISAEPMIESLQAGQTVSPLSERHANDPEQESKLNDVLIPATTTRYKTSTKKLPFGIKGISTSVIAAPNMSFKSSKEDYGNTAHKHNPGIGFQFGIGTTYMFSKKFAVSTSLLFKQNNATEVLSNSTSGEPGSNPIPVESESKYSYSYLSAPLLAEVKLSNQLTASAGPEINFLLGASVKSSGNGNSEKTSITDNSVKVGAGVQAGIRYELPGSPLAIQLVYDHRISRLNKKNESAYEPGGGSYDTPAWNMKSIQLGVTCDLCKLLKKK